MVNKKVVFVCTTIALIIDFLIVGFKIAKLNINNENIYREKKELKETNFISESITDMEKEKKEENRTDEKATFEEEKNVVEENEKEQENSKEIVSEKKQENNKETVSEKEQSEISNLNELALNLVKVEWGEDETVYYTIDKQIEDIFFITVRSKTTTESLAEYEVNTKQKSVELR